jgi:TolB-like protein
MKRQALLFGILIIAVALMISCGGMAPTVFLHPEFNFGYIERVAIVPFENVTRDQGAGFRTTRFFMSYLLSREVFEVVEPGEVKRVLEQHGITRTSDLTSQQVIDIGRELKVQALFLGSVNESSNLQSSSGVNNVVTVVARMVETDTGTSIWSATHTETGRSFWSSIFGGGEKSQSEVTRNCVKKVLNTLIK